MVLPGEVMAKDFHFAATLTATAINGMPIWAGTAELDHQKPAESAACEIAPMVSHLPPPSESAPEQHLRRGAELPAGR